MYFRVWLMAWLVFSQVLFESCFASLLQPRREAARGWVVGRHFIDFTHFSPSANWCLDVLANWRVIGSFDSFDHSSFADWNYSADERIGAWHSSKKWTSSIDTLLQIRVPEHALVRLRSPALRTRVCGDLVGRRVGAVNGTNNYHGPAC